MTREIPSSLAVARIESPCSCACWIAFQRASCRGVGGRSCLLPGSGFTAAPLGAPSAAGTAGCRRSACSLRSICSAQGESSCSLGTSARRGPVRLSAANWASCCRQLDLRHRAPGVGDGRTASKPVTENATHTMTTCPVRCLRVSASDRSPVRRVTMSGPCRPERRGHGRSQERGASSPVEPVNVAHDRDMEREWATPRSRSTPHLLNRIDHHAPEVVCLTETPVATRVRRLLPARLRLSDQERPPQGHALVGAALEASR